MRRLTMMLALIAAVAVAMPLMAGEGHGCKAPTQECLDYMAKNLANRGWVGIELETDDSTSLMRVTKVVPDSPAAEAGFEVADVLVAVNGIAFSDENEKKLEKVKQSMTPGTRMAYTVERKGARQEIEVTLAKLPSHVKAQWVGMHMLDHAEVAGSRS
jgi:S1-C subfamily serine protease